jgi:iron complex outermembrane receptor protein
MTGVALPMAPAALAQAAAEEGFSSDAIVVTARRREEQLKDVPIAITALGGDELAKRAIYNENDLQSAVPGLVIRSNGGVHAFNYVIRGQSVDTYTNSPPAVLPYINEVQIVNHSSSPLYDMAGIQVLKGPQGTLFGRNATGGAVLYETAKPTDEFEGYVLGRYSNHDKFDAEGAINLPIHEDVALRIAASHTSGGAFVDDYWTDAEYGGLDRTSVRGSLKLTPSLGITNTTVIQYTDEDGTNTPYELWSINACGTSANTPPLVDFPACHLNRNFNPAFGQFQDAHPDQWQGSLADAVALQRQLGPWVSLSNGDPYHSASQTWVINTTEIDLGTNTRLKNIFGYNKTKSRDGYDYDSSPIPFFEIMIDIPDSGLKTPAVDGWYVETRQISNELQIQGKAIDDRLDYVVGFYYLDQRYDVESNLDFNFFAGGPDPFVTRFTYTARTSTESIAGFAQGTYAITDQLNFTGGFRYTWDKTTMVQLPKSAWLFDPNFAANVPETQKASKPSWTVSLDYRLTPELMIYAAHRGSWRSGSYNYSVQPLDDLATNSGNRFLPETTYDAELGIKYSGDGLGVPVTFNADVYQQWVKNIQRAVYTVTPLGVSLLTGNVPRAKITGVEVDFSVRPSDFITFGGSVAYTNARYTRSEVFIGFTNETIKYGPFADAPKWSGTVFGEATVPLGVDTGDLTLRVDAYHQSTMPFSNVANTSNPGTILPSYELVNARLTWGDVMGTPMDVSIFARNLFNQKYFTGGNAGNSGSLPNSVNPGLPRFWGGEVRVTF